MEKFDVHTLSNLAPEKLFREAQRLEAHGHAKIAVEIGKMIIKRKPGWSAGYYALGSAFCSLGKLEEANSSLQKAIARDQKQSGYFTRHAEVLNRLGRLEDAIEAANNAIELDPKNPGCRFVLATVLRLGGEHERAYQSLMSVIHPEQDEDRVWSATLEALLASIEGQTGRLDDGIARMQALIEHAEDTPSETGASQDPSQELSELYFVQARLLDQAHRYDEAFASAQRGCRLRDALFDLEGARSECDARLTAWDAEVFSGLKSSRVRSDVPVFIFGMPRSGTSFVEQIIASHPDCFGSGELTEAYHAARELSEPNELFTDRSVIVEQLKQATLDRSARSVLKSMEKGAQAIGSRKFKRITDKLPSNYEYVGALRLMFPQAKMIHCRRRSIDTCLSCYLLDFGNRTNHAYSYSLEHLVHQYKIYERMMEHWKTVLGIEMLEVNYEELVANPESGAREIIEYLGLEWDEQCAKPHETRRSVSTLSSDQVREKVYTRADGRWKHYEDHIQTLIDALGTD